MIARVIELFEEILEMDPGSVNAEDEFRNYEDWDSLAYLSVIAKVDEDYGLVIPREDFQKIRTVKQLSDYLNDKQK